MRYSNLLEVLGAQGFFDLASVIQLTSERRETVRIQLSRWCKSGKLIPLRRGMYAFPEIGTAVKINPALLANRLYGPSYISTYWALGFYGLIPEKVVPYTSVTRRTTRSFSNAFGSFKYQTIKEDALFGYKPQEISGQKVLIAEPEKALLDLWHLARGKWDSGRMQEMRFQNTDIVNEGTLRDYARRYQSPRLLKVADLWMTAANDEQEGTIDL